MGVSKRQFMRRPKLQGLSDAEKEKRWKDHLASQGTTKRRINPTHKQAKRFLHRNAPLIDIMSESNACIMDYGASLLNPYDKTLAPCVPTYPALDSHKFSVFGRGEGTTSSANNIGAVCLQPTGVSGVESGLFTALDTYAGVDIPSASSETGVTAFTTNSPYTAADISAGTVQLRLVSAGIRIKGATAKLDEGGTVFALQEPNHGTVLGLTADTMAAYDRCFITSFDNDDWIGVQWTPRLQTDFNYHETNYGIAGTETSMGMIIKSAKASMPFRYEWVCHYEAIGSNVRGKTPSHSDSAKAEQVASVIAQAPVTVTGKLSNEAGAARVVTGKIVKSGSGGGGFWNRLGNLGMDVLERGTHKVMDILM